MPGVTIFLCILILNVLILTFMASFDVILLGSHNNITQPYLLVIST